MPSKSTECKPHFCSAKIQKAQPLKLWICWTSSLGYKENRRVLGKTNDLYYSRNHREVQITEQLPLLSFFLEFNERWEAGWNIYKERCAVQNHHTPTQPLQFHSCNANCWVRLTVTAFQVLTSPNAHLPNGKVSISWVTVQAQEQNRVTTLSAPSCQMRSQELYCMVAIHGLTLKQTSDSPSCIHSAKATAIHTVPPLKTKQISTID